MWANAHKRSVTFFAAARVEVLNKVIHRAVESGGNPKKIGHLPATLTFHFKFIGASLIRPSRARIAGFQGRFAQ